MSVSHFILPSLFKTFSIQQARPSVHSSLPFQTELSLLHSTSKTFSVCPFTKPMVPNLDLILLALLHGSFISCILLLFVFVILICLLLAFSITLLSIVLIDSYDIFSTISLYFDTLRANIELGFVLVLFTLMHVLVKAALASKPRFERVIADLEDKARHALDQVKDLSTY